MQQDTYILNNAIYSCKRKLHATKGDIVKHIATHGEVWIVEAIGGKRFSVQAAEVSKI